MPPILAAVLLLQAASEAPSFIQVTGIGRVSTPPDRADITFVIAAEGNTPDEASTALAARQRAITTGLDDLLDGAAKVASGNVNLTEVRSPDCDPNSYGNRLRMSSGNCAVTGYVATLQGTARTAAIGKAGTAVGLAVRLGARDANVHQFRLSDPAAAMRRATVVAIADARSKAQAMANAAGVGLGDVLTVTDQNLTPVDGITADDIGSVPGVVRANLSNAVVIPITPEPIETTARIYVRFMVRR